MVETSHFISGKRPTFLLEKINWLLSILRKWCLFISFYLDNLADIFSLNCKSFFISKKLAPFRLILSWYSLITHFPLSVRAFVNHFSTSTSQLLSHFFSSGFFGSGFFSFFICGSPKRIIQMSFYIIYIQ